MATAHPNQTNFVAGEVSPLMNPRVDVEKYFSALKKCENFFVFPQGTAFRRSGTGFIKPVKDPTAFTRIIPFEFSTVQAYVLEFGNQYMRVFRDEGIVVEPDVAVSGVTQSNPAVVSAVGHGYSNGDFIVISELEGMDEIDNRCFEIANVTANTFELVGVDSTGFSPYVSGGKVEKVYEIATPYQTDDLRALDYVQSADFMYLAQGMYPPRTLTRSGDTAWALGIYEHLDGPYFDENTDTGITISVSANSGTATATASTGIFATTDTSGAGGTGLSNRHIRLRDSSDRIKWARIVGYTSPTVVTIEYQGGDSGFDGSVAERWRLGAWSSTTGYPKHVGFYETRIIWANTDAQPDTFWMSKANDFDVHSPTEFDGSVNDDNAIPYTLASTKVNAINWIDSGLVLLIGTSGSEWQVNSDSLDNPLTPSNISARRQTTEGSKANIKAIRVNNSTFFIQKAGRTLEEYVFSAEANSFAGEKASILSEHILREGNTSADYLEYQQDPSSIIWVVRSDGQLVGLTYNRRQNVYAFHRQTIGGKFDDLDHAVVEDIAVIPSVDATEDTVYLIVKRTVNGTEQRYVEFIKKDFYPIGPQDKEDMWFVDSGLKLDLGEPFSSGDVTDGKSYRVVENDGMDLSAVGGSASPEKGYVFTANATATPVYGTGSLEEVKKLIVGLDHLEGYELTPVGDGAVQPKRTVLNGQLTLQDWVNKLIIGIEYLSYIEMLPTNLGGNAGTARGKIKRIDSTVINVQDSIGFSHGQTLEELSEPVSFRKLKALMDNSPDFFTGEKEFKNKQPYGRSDNYIIAQTQPYPLNILSLQPELVVYE